MFCLFKKKNILCIAFVLSGFMGPKTSVVHKLKVNGLMEFESLELCFDRYTIEQ